MALKLSQLNDDQYKVVDAPKQGNGAVSFAANVPIGVAQEGGNLLLGLGGLGRRIQRLIGGGRGMGGEGVFDEGSSANTRAREITRAKNSGQKAGQLAAIAAEFLAPTGAVARGQRLLGRGAAFAPRGTRTIAKAAARFAPEAAGTGAVSALRSGGDIGEATKEGSIAGGFSVALGGLGALARATYYPQLQESIAKALGTQGKRSGGQALEETARKASGFRVLRDRAPKLIVKTADGAEVPFDPAKATYDTTLQAWNKARKTIYDEYSSLTKRAGQSASVDLSAVRKHLADTLEEPRLSAYKNAAKSLIKDLDDGFDDLTAVPLEKAERFLEDLNANTVQGFFKGTADNASAEINAGSARAIRELLDETITSTTGEQYQALRSQYAALKSIEDDLVRKFQQNARSIGGGLPEYMGMFASGDIIGGILAGQPQQIAKGGIIATLAALKRKLADPERFLRRSFELIDNDEVSDLIVRLFGGR